MSDHLFRRLNKLERQHGEDRGRLGVTVLPYGLGDAERAAFIATSAERLAGRPFVVIPAKASHSLH